MTSRDGVPSRARGYLLAPLVLAAALLVPAPAPARACSATAAEARPPFPVYVDSLTVRVSADDTSYRRGTRLRLTVAVNRAANDAAAVSTGVYVHVEVTTPRGHVLRRFADEAADDGRITFSWLVPKTLALGHVHARATALHAIGPRVDCYALLYERGSGDATPLARIKK